VKPAFFNELYWTLQTGFTAHYYFWYSANDSSVEEVYPPLNCFIIIFSAKCMPAVQKKKLFNILFHQ